jgi:endonuclease/exonuclease/phosphatase family metal-dependent hydrolase
VKYNGKTYVCTLYYLNKSSDWVAVDEAYVGISASNTFGLYILHGSAAGCVAAVKNISYTIEDTSTNYSDDVTTPTIKLIDYNVQTGNTYYTKTAEWLLSESPDIIGLQEVGPNWYKSLKNQLGGTYGYVGVPRSGTSSTNSGNEASPIFYKKSEYKLIDSGTKWLSSTPDTVGSKISGSLYIRVMTYAVLYHKDTGTIYIYVNTHLDNADSGSIRVKQMQILMDLVDELPNYPTILTGDLNGGLESSVINAIQNTHGYTNLAKKAAKKDSTYKTATFWETNTPCVIDYIFLSDMSKFNALSYKVGNSSSRCSVYKYSDHYALISTFNLK